MYLKVDDKQISLLINFFITYNIILTSLQTTIEPNTTWIPSKKLSPTIITVAPPDVHPSAGFIALMDGVAKI